MPFSTTSHQVLKCLYRAAELFIAVNNVGIITARCRCAESPQQNVEPAALVRFGKFGSAGGGSGGTRRLPPFPCQLAELTPGFGSSSGAAAGRVYTAALL